VIGHGTPYFGPALVAAARLIAVFLLFGTWPVAFLE
jgi:hypothetical protein